MCSRFVVLFSGLAILAVGCGSGGSSGIDVDAEIVDAGDQGVQEVAPDVAGGDLLDVAPDVAVGDLQDAAADVPEVSQPDAVPDSTPEIIPFVGPLDDVLRLNHLQVKGTHNSYHVQSEGAVPQWFYTHAPLNVQLQDQGVRQVELDVHWDPELPGFTVHHLPFVDPGTTCETFKECLSVLKGWSDAHPGHQVLFVLVEPKDEIDDEKITGHYDDLDNEILSVWPRDRLVVPDDVRGGHATLLEALQTDGWPTLGQTRSKAFFLMLDNGAHRDAYLQDHPNLEGRVIFARGDGGEPWCGVVEHGNPVRDEEAIRKDVASIYLVRTTADAPDATEESNRAGAEAAMRLGAHLISSDIPARKDTGGYWFNLTGGTPSRCNPVTAPSECTSQAIEALADRPPDIIPATACNGADALCGRRFNEVSFATTHNSMSNEAEGWIAPNQPFGIERQLADGVRAMMLDLHYGDGDETDASLVYLCHSECLLGNRLFSEALSAIRGFLDANPREVVTLIFESYVTAADVAASFEVAKLGPYLHTQPVGDPWPTLGQMVDSGRRLVVFTDSEPGVPAWYQDCWAYAFETHWSAKVPSDLVCDPNRGNPDNALFILNNFLTDPFAQRELAAQVNANPFFIDRANQCQSLRSRLPNFPTVDFYDVGDVFAVVRTLNGLDASLFP